MTEGKPSPRQRTLGELLDAARGLHEIEPAIAQLRGVAEMSRNDLTALQGDEVVDAAAALSSLECLNEVLQATLQELTEAHERLQGFGRLVLRDLGSTGAALFRAVPPASEAKN
ncbi:penicillin acylase family protein [Neoroseomonas oryzicola]|uniref:Penicillin acylase family protein n=1 Tax=Neoroseomonas oryzicola TaxID=535904 RepID=A0A9X9WPC5_9PROT|nr:penicillin acylase family protein [Neoroseomonas oryzicola]MBR0662185.1 penicillin acylase family protein [Neoroseomonas oryzicola]NKE17809.1 penicillin acylase family protein [Neoroseomonas oryzicola]